MITIIIIFLFLLSKKLILRTAGRDLMEAKQEITYKDIWDHNLYLLDCLIDNRKPLVVCGEISTS